MWVTSSVDSEIQLSGTYVLKGDAICLGYDITSALTRPFFFLLYGNQSAILHSRWIVSPIARGLVFFFFAGGLERVSNTLLDNIKLSNISFNCALIKESISAFCWQRNVLINISVSPLYGIIAMVIVESWIFVRAL